MKNALYEQTFTDPIGHRWENRRNWHKHETYSQILRTIRLCWHLDERKKRKDDATLKTSWNDRLEFNTRRRPMNSLEESPIQC